MTTLIKSVRCGLNGEILDVSFTFHNVGQGLFYSGEIGDFSFIYDCGVKQTGVKKKRRTHLTSIVKDYIWHKKQESGNLNIDLLMLSHLHEDHISGLDTLFNNEISVDTVILPYLTPIERLMVALQSPNLSNWFYDFWADPVTFLIENGVKRIILIGGEEGYPPEENFDRLIDRRENKVDYDEMRNDDELKRKVEKNDQQLQEFLDGRVLLAKSHNKSLMVQGIWFFRFFNYKLEDQQQKNFEACITNKSISNNLIEVIRDKLQRKKLHHCYKTLNGDFNNTSLVVYHGPIPYEGKYLISGNVRYLLHPKYIQYDKPDELLEFVKSHSSRIYYRKIPNLQFLDLGIRHNTGHFLTGDIDLNIKMNEITTHFKPYFSRIGVVLIPHHGSKENWNISLLKKIRDSIWVASAGINNVDHPNFDVTNKIFQRGFGNIPFFCNEVNGIRIHS